MTIKMQRLSVKDSFSDFLMVRSGVPQNSVLAASHIILYKSDMWHSVKSNMIAYTAETTLLVQINHVHSRALVANQLNTELNLISD